nr:hypothetical protein StreXyl84_65360 [Streptomyces sp. Xyl84]
MWNGKLYAFDAASGRKLWTHTTGGELQTNPAIGEGTVFITADKDPGAGEGRRYALRR